MSDFAQIRFLPNRPLLRELSADRLNTILQEIKRNKPKGERGITVRQDGTGTYIGLAASLPTRIADTQETHPFKISSRQNPDNENQYLVTVQPGTVNGLLPTNLFDDGALTEFAVSANQLAYVKLIGQTNGTTQFVSCEIEVDQSPAEPQLPTAFTLPAAPEFLLGLVRNATAYNTIQQSLTVTGSVQVTEQREELPQPGELPYINYYVWA
jgi:hypothetical protein